MRKGKGVPAIAGPSKPGGGAPPKQFRQRNAGERWLVAHLGALERILGEFPRRHNGDKRKEGGNHWKSHYSVVVSGLNMPCLRVDFADGITSLK